MSMAALQWVPRGSGARLLLSVALWWYAGTLGVLVGWLAVALAVHSLVAIYRANLSSTACDGQLLTTAEIAREHNFVVVTGCDSGLGHAVADKLCERFSVIATVLDPQGPGAIALNEKGAYLVQLDLTDSESIKKAALNIGECIKAGRLHAVVNNAGQCIMGELDWFTNEQLDRVLQVNLVGPIQFTKSLLPRILADRSRVVNVTGVNGVLAASGEAAFCAAKFGLEGFSEALRMELQKYDVRVITVRPGDYSGLARLDEADQPAPQYRQMWTSMEPSARKKYAARFNAFFKTVIGIRGKFSASNFDGIRAVFEEILLAKNPQDEYEEGSALFMALYKLCALLPKCLRAKLIQCAMDADIRKYLYLGSRS